MHIEQEYFSVLINPVMFCPSKVNKSPAVSLCEFPLSLLVNIFYSIF